MDLEFLTVADQTSTSRATGKRQGIGPTAIILRLIAGTTIACSFIQVVRGECTPITVIQFWLSLFVGAAAQSAAGDSRSDTVDVAPIRGDCRAI